MLTAMPLKLARYETPGEYLVGQIVIYSNELLQENKLRIIEVITKVGIVDVLHW